MERRAARPGDGRLFSPRAAAALDNHHVGATVKVIWSPVPPLDLGLEYSYVQRGTAHALTGGSRNSGDSGELDRAAARAVFKF